MLKQELMVLVCHTPLRRQESKANLEIHPMMPAHVTSLVCVKLIVFQSAFEGIATPPARYSPLPIERYGESIQSALLKDDPEAWNLAYPRQVVMTSKDRCIGQFVQRSRLSKIGHYCFRGPAFGFIRKMNGNKSQNADVK